MTVCGDVALVWPDFGANVTSFHGFGPTLTGLVKGQAEFGSLRGSLVRMEGPDEGTVGDRYLFSRFLHHRAQPRGALDVRGVGGLGLLLGSDIPEERFFACRVEFRCGYGRLRDVAHHSLPATQLNLVVDRPNHFVRHPDARPEFPEVSTLDHLNRQRLRIAVLVTLGLDGEEVLVDGQPVDPRRAHPRAGRSRQLAADDHTRLAPERPRKVLHPRRERAAIET